MKFTIGEFVSVYTDILSDSFGIGFILGSNNDHLLLQSIDVYGQIYGLTIYNIKEIVKIEKDTPYSHKILKLMQLKGVKKPEINIATSKNLLLWVLEKAKNENEIVNVQLQQSHQCDITGFLKSIDSTSCEILQIDNLGNAVGSVYFLLEDISSFHVGGIENQDLKLLYFND